jgi:hypothetical protein
MSCFECSLVFVPFLYAYIVISLADVEFGEYDSSTEVTNEVPDEQERILVTNRPGIDLPVILYWSQLAVLLFNEEEG